MAKKKTKARGLSSIARSLSPGSPAMSQTLTLELSDQGYETIRRQAEAAATSQESQLNRPDRGPRATWPPARAAA